ncbi:MAG: hypothetical protein J6U84_03430 [Bacteroidales bacterium]|nr:hypothetical protein [Bacteroidales bacterium]
MRLTISYGEIENKIKEIAKLDISLMKNTSKSLKLRYNSSNVFVPNVELLINVISVSLSKIECSYDCNPIMKFAVDKLLPQIFKKLPEEVIVSDGDKIMIELAEIDKLRNVFQYISLSDIEMNENDIDIFLILNDI